MTSTVTPELIGLAQRTLRDLRLRVAGSSGGGPDALREAGVDIEVISPRARTSAPRTRRSTAL